MVDENRIEGTARNIGGKIQDAVGAVTGDTATQARGQMNRAAGDRAAGLWASCRRSEELCCRSADCCSLLRNGSWRRHWSPSSPSLINRPQAYRRFTERLLPYAAIDRRDPVSRKDGRARGACNVRPRTGSRLYPDSCVTVDWLF